MNVEANRREEAQRRNAHWKRLGPNVSERPHQRLCFGLALYPGVSGVIQITSARCSRWRGNSGQPAPRR